MFVILRIVVVFAVSIDKLCLGQINTFEYPKYEASLPLSSILNMTAELIRDAAYKLKHSEKIQENYQDSINYHLGTIAAGVQATFKRMLQHYRMFGNVSDHQKHTYDITEMINAYHIMQGYYNELRADRDMFYQTLEDFRQRKLRLKETFGPTSTPKLRRMLGATPKRNVPRNHKRYDNDEEYKQQLRYNMWKKKWNNFMPEIEGVDIELDHWN